MRLLGYDDDDSPYLALPAVVLAACAVLLVVGAALFLGIDRSSGGPPGAASGSSQPGAGCAAALEAARQALADADRLDAALVEQAELMNGLRAGRITQVQILERGASSLAAASRASVALDVSRSRYDTEMRTCRP